jgi:hypothetical protein
MLATRSIAVTPIDHQDHSVGATLVVALLVVALGRHKACPYSVGTVLNGPDRPQAYAGPLFHVLDCLAHAVLGKGMQWQRRILQT